MNSRPVIAGTNQGKLLNVLGDGITVQVHGNDTGGSLAVCIASGHPGHGPPPHIHSREDETFHVLEGEIEGFVGSQSFKLTAGMTAFLPRNIPHTYRVAGTQPARFLVVLSPAGFERFFEEVGAMSKKEQQNIPRIVELGRQYGLEFLSPQ